MGKSVNFLQICLKIYASYKSTPKAWKFVIASERIARSAAIHKLQAVSVGYFRKCVNLKSLSKNGKFHSFSKYGFALSESVLCTNATQILTDLLAMTNYPHFSQSLAMTSFLRFWRFLSGIFMDCFGDFVVSQ